MARRHGPGIDRAAASTIALAVHLALFGAWLSWTRSPGRAAPGDDALQVVWIERPRPAAGPAPSTPRPATRSAVATPIPTVPARQPSIVPTGAATATPPSAEPEPSRPLSAVFVEQGRELARTRHGHDFTRNALVDPQTVRIDVAPERIRMREPLTPAKVVAAVGVLFGGAGYETDPCPRIRRNLGHLVTAGRDDPALREELHRHRRFCQQ